MMTIKKIVVPLDFSDLSRELLDYALSLAQCFGAGICLVHIIQVAQVAEMYGDIEAGGPAFAGPELMRQVRAAAQKQMEEYRHRVEAGKVEVEAEVLAGVHASEIVKYAEERNADLIIIGSHGRSGWQHFVLGSVAEKVARKSSIPVLIYKPKNPAR
jgi:nucleotide-binding universal stress UspA family protein